MMGDPGKTMLKLAEDLDRKAALRSIEVLKLAVDRLVEEGAKASHAYADRIEELKAEVQTWKQRYEAERQRNSCLGWTLERLEG